VDTSIKLLKLASQELIQVFDSFARLSDIFAIADFDLGRYRDSDDCISWYGIGKHVLE